MMKVAQAVLPQMRTAGGGRIINMGSLAGKEGLANLAAYLLSDYSAYVTGEVVTIDGGEWLRNGGEFSHLEDITPDMWDSFEKMRK